MNAVADPTWRGGGVEVAVEIRNRALTTLNSLLLRKLQDFWTPNIQTTIKSTTSAVSMFSC